MNKVALVTGASSGIGKELAGIHAEQGGDLIIVARREHRLNIVKAELEERHAVQVKVIPKDLCRPGAAEEVYKEVKDAGIQVEYLINNAGFSVFGKFHECACEQSLAMLQLHVVTLSALCRFFLADFVERNSGRILNVSSTSALFPGGPLLAVYFAVEAYITRLSNALAEELRDTNVTVTVLLPGPTETEWASASGYDKSPLIRLLNGRKKMGPARSVAQDGYNAMLSGKMNVISGVPLFVRIMFPIIPLMPKKLILRLFRKLHEAQN